MKNSKAKGARYEREIAHILKTYGYNARRTQQYCGATDESSDVVGLDGFHIECKHYANTGFKYEWLDQAIRDCNNNIPIVVHKIDRKESVVTLRLTDFLEIIKNENGTD